MKDKGLYRKYHITKADGSACNPKAEYFVLRIDKDPHARNALRAYADSVESENASFASDLRYWIDHGLDGFNRAALQRMGFRLKQEKAQNEHLSDE